MITLFQLILLGVPLPPLYHYTVRPTVIGAVLNGRKYPSALAPVAV